MFEMLITAAVVGVGVLAILARGLFIVQQSEAVVVERLGSYSRTLEPGINFLIPILEKARPIKIRRYESTGLGGKELEERLVQETKIDVRETVLNFPDQPVVTNDNVSVRVNGALYFQIQDPVKAVYEVENLIQAVEVLAKTTLRSVVGSCELDSMFSSRDQINDQLQTVMDEAGDKWGVKINRVEIQDITLPEEVDDAMRQQMTAERKRRATVTEANGYKEAQIREAEGDKEAAIQRAEGQKGAIERVLHAGGEDQPIDPQPVLSFLIAQQYMDTLPNIAKDGERVLVPYEATGLMGSLESIQDLFQNGVGGSSMGSFTKSS